MAATPVTCPHCRRVLAAAHPPRPGLSLQCPACGHRLAGSPAAPAQAVQAVPPLPGPPPLAPAERAPGARVLTLALAFGGLLLFLGLGVGLAVYCLSGDRGGDEPAPVTRQAPVPALTQPPPPPPPPPWLPEAEQRKVDQAIARGVAYLKSAVATDRFGAVFGGNDGPQQVGASALAALALLNCDVPADDPLIRKVIDRIRAEGPRLTPTYALGPCIWFLDRLGDPRDRPLIQDLALRLIAGQDPQGGWPYTCPLVPPDLKAPLVALLRSRSAVPADAPPALKNLPALRFRLGEKITPGAPVQVTTNSLTLFAMVALWAARKHEAPVDRSLALAEARFRTFQRPDGSWIYHIGATQYTFYDSMTCAGLLALAVGRGIKEGKLEAYDKDPAIARGFAYLGRSVGKLRPRRAAGVGKIVGADAYDDLYYFWAVERVAVVYDLRRIAGVEWYAWGAGILVPAQNADGSWNDLFGPGIDTSFALLFLKRVNVAQDLTEKLRLAG